jgi:catechol 2,3-dioxygenase-like lactoylglutathione lyase family enzyme
MLFYVDPKNLEFYKDLLTFLGWPVIYADDRMLGCGGEGNKSLWFTGQLKPDVRNDYDGTGLNHLAFGTTTQAEVDEAAAYVTGQGIALLFDTPRHRPEFSANAESTYYQIMFETPDRLLLEIVYMGPK